MRSDMQVLLEAMENGIIDVAEIREKCEMAERQSILNSHPYKITQTKDGQWTTHYMEGGVRRQIKRKSRRVVENFLVKYYKDKEENPTLDELFMKVQQEKLAYDHKKEATISRNQREYNRFFAEFGKRRIKDIDALEIENFLRKSRREKDLSKKSFGYLTSILRIRLIWTEQLEEYADIREKMDYLSLPPYSPDLNPIEQVWRKTRREKTHNRFFSAISKLINVLDDYFAQFFMPNDQLKSLCSFSCFA